MIRLKWEQNEDFYLPECRCEFEVTVEMKQLWAIELDLLKEFDKVCKANSLKYWACGGTLLGAVRHNGFIPWDNDIDVMMLRKDYDKLCKIASDYFSFPYFFQTEENDPGCIRGHAQLRNSETTALQREDYKKGLSFNQGVFIDIFPLDNIPNDMVEKKKYRDKLFKLREKSYRYRDITCARVFGNSPKEIIKKILSKIHKSLKLKYNNKWYVSYETLMRKYGQIETNSVAILAIYSERFEWEKKYFDSSSTLAFENTIIPVPIGYKNILNKSYGDWEIPLKGNACHEDLVVDVDRSYKYYTEKEK